MGVYILIHFDENCTVCYRTKPFELIFFAAYYYCCLWFTFWISFYYHYTFSFFLFQEILFARLIASLFGWYLSFWFHTFLFLCFLVSMYHGKYDILFTWFLVCFIFRTAACSFIILLTLWKFSWKFENMYFVRSQLLNMKNRKHVNLKDIMSEYWLSCYYLFYSISLDYMYDWKQKNIYVCKSVVLS